MSEKWKMELDNRCIQTNWPDTCPVPQIFFRPGSFSACWRDREHQRQRNLEFVHRPLL